MSVPIDQRYKYRPVATSRHDRKSSRPWTDTENDILRREYDGTSATADRIALKLGRTFAAIVGHAALMGLRRHKSPNWTNTEEATLRANAQKPLGAICRLLPNRTRIAISVKLKRLRLRRRDRDEWYTKRDACELLGVDHHILQRYINDGKLVASHQNGTTPQQDGGAMWRIERADLHRFVVAYAGDFQGRNVDVFGLVQLLTKR